MKISFKRPKMVVGTTRRTVGKGKVVLEQLNGAALPSLRYHRRMMDLKVPQRLLLLARPKPALRIPSEYRSIHLCESSGSRESMLSGWSERSGGS